MGEHARFAVDHARTTEECLVIQDIGNWSGCLTVTNDVDWVVKQVAPLLNGRRLEYIDSEGQRDQILVAGGRFAGFALAGEKSL